MAKKAGSNTDQMSIFEAGEPPIEEDGLEQGKPRGGGKWFDAAALPDAPGRQSVVPESYILYLVFPNQESLIEALQLLSCGDRKNLAAYMKTAKIASEVHLKSAGKTAMEYWRWVFNNYIPF